MAWSSVLAAGAASTLRAYPPMEQPLSSLFRNLQAAGRHGRPGDGPSTATLIHPLPQPARPHPTVARGSLPASPKRTPHPTPCTLLATPPSPTQLPTSSNWSRSQKLRPRTLAASCCPGIPSFPWLPSVQPVPGRSSGRRPPRSPSRDASDPSPPGYVQEPNPGSWHFGPGESFLAPSALHDRRDRPSGPRGFLRGPPGWRATVAPAGCPACSPCPPRLGRCSAPERVKAASGATHVPGEGEVHGGRRRCPSTRTARTTSPPSC